MHAFHVISCFVTCARIRHCSIANALFYRLEKALQYAIPAMRACLAANRELCLPRSVLSPFNLLVVIVIIRGTLNHDVFVIVVVVK